MVGDGDFMWSRKLLDLEVTTAAVCKTWFGKLDKDCSGKKSLQNDCRNSGQIPNNNPYIVCGLLYVFTIFNICLEEIRNNCLDDRRGVRIGGRRIGWIRLADGVALPVEEERTLTGMLRDFNKKCEEFGIRLNIKKTKSMVISKMSKLGL